ncbi:MAG: GNAT family N-acetyltransferase [Alphaproteobacteria bacterium]|nr:GNAT family N-acetyltransferase [Alphaproteobacteria bacterium]
MKGIALELAPVESRPALEAEWRAFEARAAHGFFLSAAWIGTWLATLPPALRLYRAVGRRSGQAIGLAVVAVTTTRPFLRAPSRGLHLNSTGDERWDCIAIEHNGFLAAPADQAVLIAALGDWFTAGAGGLGDELRLPGIGGGLATDFLDRNRLLHSTQQRPGFAVDLARVRDADDFTAVLSSNARQQLRRAQREFERDGAIAVTEARDAGEALAFFAALKELHVRSWQRRGQRHAFVEPYFEVFHRALIEREFGHGAIQLLRITVAERAIGYLYNFRRAGRVYAYQSGFDDGERKRRPGVLSHALAIGHNAAAGAAVYDFLAGENQLKTSFATDRYALAWQVIRFPRLKYRLESAARHAKQRLFG